MPFYTTRPGERGAFHQQHLPRRYLISHLQARDIYSRRNKDAVFIMTIPDHVVNTRTHSYPTLKKQTRKELRLKKNRSPIMKYWQELARFITSASHYLAKNFFKSLFLLEPMTRFERVTLSLQVRRSGQLSYIGISGVQR